MFPSPSVRDFEYLFGCRRIADLYGQDSARSTRSKATEGQGPGRGFTPHQPERDGQVVQDTVRGHCAMTWKMRTGVSLASNRSRKTTASPRTGSCRGNCIIRNPSAVPMLSTVNAVVSALGIGTCPRCQVKGQQSLMLMLGFRGYHPNAYIALPCCAIQVQLHESRSLALSRLNPVKIASEVDLPKTHVALHSMIFTDDLCALLPPLARTVCGDTA